MGLVRQTAVPWRQRLAARLETAFVQRSLTAPILINAAILGLETSVTMMAGWGPPLIEADTAMDASLRGVESLHLKSRPGAPGLLVLS